VSDLTGAIEQLAADLAARPDSADLARRLEWLIDVLVLRGHLTEGHRGLLGKIANDRSTVRLAVFRDKRAIASPDIDCASLIALCGARCCSMDVTLSAQDVHERKLPWVISQPYMLPKDSATGYCACMGSGGACTVYDDRPGTCRAYDCRHDPRVWLDFEQRIPAPMPPRLVPPGAAGPPEGSDRG
jgi:hypothetical protein